jgi:hypothetical protein
MYATIKSQDRVSHIDEDMLLIPTSKENEVENELDEDNNPDPYDEDKEYFQGRPNVEEMEET